MSIDLSVRHLMVNSCRVFIIASFAFLVGSCWSDKSQSRHPVTKPSESAAINSGVNNQISGDLNTALTEKFQNAPGVKNLPYVILPMSDGRATEDIGTVTTLEDGPLSAISRKSCAVSSKPKPVPISGFDGKYTMTKEVAANLGLAKTISWISSLGGSYDNHSTYTIQLEESSVQYLPKDDLQAVFDTTSCKKVPRDGALVIVVGYIQAKRTLSIENTQIAKGHIEPAKAGSVGVAWNPGSDIWSQTDTAPTALMVVLATLPAALPGSEPNVSQLQSITTSRKEIEQITKHAKINIQADKQALAIAAAIRDEVGKNQLVVKNGVTVIQDIDTRPKIPSNPLVRIFRDSDRAEANAVKEIVEAHYPDAKVDVDIFPMTIQPAQGQMEIWLPARR